MLDERAAVARHSGCEPLTVTHDNLEHMIARTALGDRAAFSDLYSHTSAKLFGICLRVLNDRAEAEEAAQEVYVKIWRRADRYRVNGLSPMTWLITIARNTAIDRLRRRRDAQPGLDVADTLADTAPGPEDLVVQSGERARLMSCLNELNANRAEAVRRAYLGGETYADLAAQFDVPLNTMRTWLRRSLLKLKECLTR
ncbi:sigma-70 family RNA polymerase sigma factor [Roseovarius sp. M141]|uniref:sigma-70 family RNA polymerase sigma factor n=1 Tax=Roseovarius sp. M141 TaxID=2583806 RepID=UPI0020CF57EC|nr:sigma-70 family RNA polymerase sigma factor [Roseovarius sp. M141]